MKKRFTEEQIIQVLREQEAVERTADGGRRRGISQGLMAWKSQMLGKGFLIWMWIHF